MSQTEIEVFERLSYEIRHCFNLLRAVSDQLLADRDITTAQRAILEALHRYGPTPVPQIAKARGVTRQHIQVLADALFDLGYVVWKDNPGHKRSQLLALSDGGKRLFAEIRERERDAADQVLIGLREEDMKKATVLLKQLAGNLDAMLERSEG